MSYRRSRDAWRLKSFLFAAMGAALVALWFAPTLAPALGKRIFIPMQQATPQSSSTLDSNGGVLPTDSEIEMKLRRADEYVAQERFDLAAVIWQNVLDMSSTALRSADGRQYTSVQYHVEEQLRNIALRNPAGLNAYRSKADVSALGLMAAAVGDLQQQKLSEVVRRYFFSSHGDQAAYVLGCLALDRFDFNAASRLFGKMVDQHPDYLPKATGRAFASRGEVLLRLAIAHARSGDTKSANATVARLEREALRDVTPGTIAMVKRDIASGDAGRIDPALVGEGEWPIAHGTAARDGVMQGLPADTKYIGVWREHWVAHFPSVSTPNRSQRERMRYKWVSRDSAGGDWTPSGRVLLSNGNAYFKSYKQLICVDAESGKLRWRSNESEPYVQPLNSTLKEEILSFGDRTRTEIAIDRGVVFHFDDDTSQTIKSSTNKQFRGNNTPMMMAYPDRYGNKLVAIDASTGKLLWQFATDKDSEGNAKALRFTAAPVPSGGLLFVPAYDGTSHWLYALNGNRVAEGGRVVWKTLLCDDPKGGVSPWQTVGVSVAGGDVYVCNGTGWVFNLDAASGHVRWAVPYMRRVSMTNTRYNNRVAATPLGFDVNTVVPVGRHLVVMSSDAADPSGDFDSRDNVGIFSLDRRTGQKLWHVPRDGATHFLGVYDDALFVASADSVVKYSITKKQGSRLKENVDIGRITGRGFVSPDGVYLPTYGQSASVLRLDLNSLKPQSRVGVRLSVKDEQGDVAYHDPIGNLFSDGSRIFGIGLERVYALRHGTTKVVKRPNPVVPIVGDEPGDSSSKIAGNDRDTLRLHGIEETVESFTTYFASLHPTDAERKKFEQLIKQLGAELFDDRELAEKTLRTLPVVPVEQLKRAVEAASDPERVTRAKRILIQTSGQRERVLNAALRVIAEKEIKGLGKQTLAAVSLCTERYLLVSVRHALVATAEAKDVPALRASLKDSSPDVRIVAAAAIGAVLNEKSVGDLNQLFKDKEPKVKLAAARALANMGDRGSLAKFIEMMGHDDVYIRSNAVSALRSLTGQRFAFIAYDKQEVRDAGVKKWQEWIAAKGKTAKLEFPLSKSRFKLGRTLIANYTQSKVYEIDSRSGKETWSTTVTRPWVVFGTPQGHRVVTSYSSRALYEYDAAGKRTFEMVNVPSYPQGVQKLENGNILVACSSSNRVIEVRPDKTLAWDKTFQKRPSGAQRLENGNTLITLQSTSKVIEVDREGNVKWELTGLSSPISSSRLPNGNTLVCEVSGRRVREFDRNKKVVWDSSQHNVTLQSPICAQRLDNGHTMISDYKGIREITPKGKIVWQRMETGIRGFHRY